MRPLGRIRSRGVGIFFFCPDAHPTPVLNEQAGGGQEQLPWLSLDLPAPMLLFPSLSTKDRLPRQGGGDEWALSGQLRGSQAPQSEWRPSPWKSCYPLGCVTGSQRSHRKECRRGAELCANQRIRWNKSYIWIKILVLVVLSTHQIPGQTKTYPRTTFSPPSLNQIPEMRF